ncbi:hypothetical protein RvY_10288 [Ramazzottius varieornatus]|uniref:DNA-directed RNA polymerases I, II, and III subunit RPABC4 n=1 Tax=Ramazzottius varieornatus TaxID=947166 RepID=A0A1D1VLA0_RAMVA|nr:hypothetical protein RvY_10288 [Ramazzottius varieornatus]
MSSEHLAAKAAVFAVSSKNILKELSKEMMLSTPRCASKLVTIPLRWSNIGTYLVALATPLIPVLSRFPRGSVWDASCAETRLVADWTFLEHTPKSVPLARVKVTEVRRLTLPGINMADTDNQSTVTGSASKSSRDSRREPMDTGLTEEDKKPVVYICGECHRENPIRGREPIRCQECGYRILYKKRTKRLIVFDAR